MKENTWYVLARKDKRYRYNFHPVFDRSHVFKSLKMAELIKTKKELELKVKLNILKRTCQQL